MPKVLKITAKAPKVGEDAVCTVKFNSGESLKEAAKMFGEDVVLNIFEQQVIVKVQAGARKCLENGQDPQAWTDKYVPGVKAPSIAKDPVATARSAISQMSDEEKAALIADLQNS